MRGYRGIRDYAAIGDGCSAALIASDCSIDWLCWPRFDSSALFYRLLDATKGGFFQIVPHGQFSSSQHYLDQTNVLATDLLTDHGSLRVIDLMPIGGGPTRIMRKVECTDGAFPCRMVISVTPEFGSEPASVELARGRADFYWRGGTASLESPFPLLRDDEGCLSADFEVRQGDCYWFVLTHSIPAHVRSFSAEGAEETLSETIAYWRSWADKCSYHGRYRNAVQRSALALKLLTYQPTGAIIAAPTTSLPEWVGAQRNWDYRYSWIRDAAWIIEGLMSVGYHDEAMVFWKWLESLDLRSGDPMVVYSLDGAVPGTERILDHVEGFRGSRPVRVGNAARKQRQLDVYGELVRAIFICSRSMAEMRPLRPELWSVVRRLIDRVNDTWMKPDRGLWEIRAGEKHYLASKLMCWTALDRAIQISESDGLEAPIAEWRDIRDAIRNRILNEGYNSNLGAFTQSFASPDLDCSALLIPLVGMLDPKDFRMTSTVAKIRNTLELDGLLYRYRTEDGLGGPEGAFTICTFWLVEVLALQGRLEEADRLFGRMLQRSSKVGLFSEEIDPESGDLLGNYPQGLPHLALIRAAVSLETSVENRREF